MKDLLIRSKQELRRVFKDEDTRFMMITGLKVSGISFLINLVVYGLLFQVMRLNYVFFRAHGSQDLMDESVFYGYLLTEASDNLTISFIFHILLFFIGVYVGWLILRPFRMMGEYCEEVIENRNAIYKVDEFSTYKLLTRFSEFFFEYLRESRKRGEIVINSIPPQFSGIHRPVYDRIFMLHFGLLLVIIGISGSVFVIENASAVFESMIELSTKTLVKSKEASRFFSAQTFVIDDIVALSIILITISYLALGVHLYEKVSGAAFGIFSTMRSFMKGNYSSRVHLLGYVHLRGYTRKLNKYLDYIQNNFKKEGPKG